MRDYYKASLLEVATKRGERPEYIMTGCAYGIDTYVPYAAIEIWPKIKVICVIPAAPHNDEFVRDIIQRSGTELVHMYAYEGMTNTERYMDRNDELAKRADELAAFPHTKSEVIRSGTWATVRRFRKLNKPVHIFPINERTR
jgi:predicted Rossmann fold nucleotide-binding protein DprA/Smf involved in DNA uptake